MCNSSCSRLYLSLRPDFTSKLEHELAFGTPKCITAPYDKINHALVNLSYNCDVKSSFNVNALHLPVHFFRRQGRLIYRNTVFILAAITANQEISVFYRLYQLKLICAILLKFQTLYINRSQFSVFVSFHVNKVNDPVYLLCVTPLARSLLYLSLNVDALHLFMLWSH